MVSGLGHDAVRLPEGVSDAFVEIRGVVTDLAVLDFEGEARTMRVRSVHPGVTLDQVFEATGFEIKAADDLDETRPPTVEEQRLIREVIDPEGRCLQEIAVR